MGEIENKILLLLESEYRIDSILKELNIEEESLADKIIELESKELINLEDKNWLLTQKGKDILQEMRESLKKLKIEYLHGNIDKEKFEKKRKELESIIITEKSVEDKTEEKHKIEKEILDDRECKEKKVNCPKCGKENRIVSNYCAKCGESLKN